MHFPFLVKNFLELKTSEKQKVKILNEIILIVAVHLRTIIIDRHTNEIITIGAIIRKHIKNVFVATKNHICILL